MAKMNRPFRKIHTDFLTVSVAQLSLVVNRQRGFLKKSVDKPSEMWYPRKQKQALTERSTAAQRPKRAGEGESPATDRCGNNTPEPQTEPPSGAVGAPYTLR